jgi:GNAT superfamily N-acetyltransferase
MRVLFMNAKNKINLKKISADDPKLPEVIKFSIGYPTEDKVLEIVRTYAASGNELVGAYLEGGLISVVGLAAATEKITIQHISVLPEFQRQGIGKLLLDNIKKCYAENKIIAETDEESVGFYLKSGFSCHAFYGEYENLRYSCEFLHE